MMTNGAYINEISDWLVILCRIIEKRKSRQRYDITHDAEDVFAQLLNMLYGWNLDNPNRGKPNFPAGDLIDDKNSLFVQVTSDKDAGTKVRNTVNGFVKQRTDGSRFCERYDRLIILLASYGENKRDKDLKQRYKDAARSMLEKKPDVAKMCSGKFDPETDIWNCDTIVEELGDFNKHPLKQLGEINGYLKEQIQELGLSSETADYPEKCSPSSKTADYPENAYRLRRLTDNLWINWKTGRLAKTPETALSGSKTGSEGELLTTLSSGELRLLSVLVQGEGAVVSWEEICERADLKTGRSGEEDEKKAAGNAVRNLLEKVQELSRIIDPEKDEKGCRISLCGWGSANSYGDSEKIKDDDWAALREGFERDNPEKRRAYAKAWFRRYYAQLAGSFENRITNARTDGMGGKVFGTYTMIEAYANARTYLDGKDKGKTETMLDRIEKWYRKRPEKGGRILVLHGQPGDGKTTFCKKAVYAHRFEGWLTEASCVLRISLNPSESSILITGEDGQKKLKISNAFCLKGFGEDEFFKCSVEDIPENALIIFDGYDELAARLGGVTFEEDERAVSPFYSFLKAAEKLAESDERNWRIIITSRTMCIRHELKTGIRTLEKDVEFAPLTHSQQERMLARMAELEDEQADADALLAYRETLHGLWENEDMDRLLMIPALFRMIVACRFKDAETGYSEAVLYSKLFYNLMVHRGKNPAAIKKALGEYETIAARIFNYQEDTCPYEEKPESEELIYLFLTKGDGEEGRLGFLHGSFRQFFLARYIVSGIQAASEEKRTEFVKFFSSLRAARIEGDDAAAFTYIGQITRLQGTANDPFGMKKITKETLERCLGKLSDEKTYGEGIAKGEVFKRGPEAEKGGLPGAENAVFNLLTALGIMERARTGKDGTERTQPGRDGADGTRPCKDEDKSICFGTYKNICDYLRKGDYNGIDLSGLDFSGAELGRAYLKSAKLSGTSLSGAILSDANLVGADLSKANLTGAAFTAANLSGSSLEEAVVMDGAEKIISFRRANLEAVKLKDAELGKADFSGANLVSADLSGAKLIRANLLGANISGACLNGAHLDGANLKRADLSESRLTETQLPGAHMEKACLKGATFWKANLTEAHLEEARLDGAVLAEAVLVNARLERASLKQAYLCAYPGMGTFKWKGKVCGADPKCDADLKGANLAGADFAGAFLSKEGYRQVKTYEKAGGRCAFGLPGKAPDGRIKLAEERYQDFIGWSGGKSIINPMKEELVPYGIYQSETLMWRVLRRECGRVLLITEKVIEVRVYHPEGKVITWEDCDLRKWLNEEFVKEAFTDEERERIACVNNQNPDNKRYGKAGRPTEDRVFALSIDEAKAYFETDEDRTAVLTDHAYRVLKETKDLAYTRHTERGVVGWWWLRSPGDVSNRAACVVPDGGVRVDGYYVINADVGVRPALWLNL